MDAPEKESVVRVWLVRIALALAAVLLLVGLGMVLKSMLSGKVSGKKPVTTIKLMPDTPPPPPPPPKEPPKEQPKDQPREIKMEQPKQEAPQPPAEALKMEGAAGDGPSPFAAGTVNNEYKGGDVATKIGGGASRHQFDWFTGMIKSRIEDALAKDPQLAKGKYKVVVHVWIKPDGKLDRFELAGSSGNSVTDERIKTALDQMQPSSEAPPEDMPQPIKLRITARTTG